jgi:hypothetical protein
VTHDPFITRVSAVVRDPRVKNKEEYIFSVVRTIDGDRFVRFHRYSWNQRDKAFADQAALLEANPHVKES